MIDSTKRTPDRLGPLFFATGQAWRRVLGQRLTDAGLSESGALLILELLRAGDKLLRQRELARRLGVETSSVVRVLDILEESGHVERLPDPADRRAKQLRLTLEGRRIGHTAERIVTSLRYELFSGVSLGELESMHRVLLKISTTLHHQVRP